MFESMTIGRRPPHRSEERVDRKEAVMADTYKTILHDRQNNDDVVRVSFSDLRAVLRSQSRVSRFYRKLEENQILITSS
jgi:hypothetical protein